ncbi:hypothetical protein [Amycolatopsis sp. DSM 110486]|uniref:hypothetical protein n=1 Tax=Amycolatopsis sp. DSM 110486 TaxID=2865832 RepID=UPI001C696279|nr:hypothetical protein [Amycolatopsis sp. DSM 110486]QYN23151.1 hypothetical protein K1T34_12235 [Amycolatopsis sp. DSM 110486]
MPELTMPGPATREDAVGALQLARADAHRTALTMLAGNLLVIAVIVVVCVLVSRSWMPPWWGWGLIGLYGAGALEGGHDLAAIVTGRMTFDTRLDDGTTVHLCGRRHCPHYPEVTP